MTRHNELIQYLIDKYNFKSYLEVGVCKREHNIDLIKCDSKFGVDPDVNSGADFIGTSDAFFSINGKGFDMIFLDGLHHADQLQKDFENALSVLNEGGMIMMHDCNPHSERITHVPRDNGEWCGDCYRFASTLAQYDDIDFRTVDFDYGCAVVWKADKKGKANVNMPDWEYFDKNRKKLLRLVSVEEFLTIK